MSGAETEWLIIATIIITVIITIVVSKKDKK